MITQTEEDLNQELQDAGIQPPEPEMEEEAAPPEQVPPEQQEQEQMQQAPPEQMQQAPPEEMQQAPPEQMQQAPSQQEQHQVPPQQQQQHQQQQQMMPPQNISQALRQRLLEMMVHFGKGLVLGDTKASSEIFIDNAGLIFNQEAALGKANIVALLERLRARHEKLDFNLDPDDVYLDPEKGVGFFKFTVGGHYKCKVGLMKGEYVWFGTLHFDETGFVRRMEIHDNKIKTVVVERNPNMPEHMIQAETEEGGWKRKKRWGKGGRKGWVDWTCSHCNTHNPARHTYCAGCEKPFMIENAILHDDATLEQETSVLDTWGETPM